MSTPLRFFILLITFFALPGWAQDFQFRLDGSFPVRTDSPSPTPVNFSVKWFEKGNRITGVYSDNYFIESAPVEGSTETLGRRLNVTFPYIRNGVKSITILLYQTGSATGSSSLSLSTRDAAGATIDSYALVGLVTTNTTGGIREAEGNTCTIGFGDLTGYCGLYAGTINKISDQAFHCPGITSPITRLELGTNGRFTIYFGYTDTTIGLPLHNLGLIPAGQLGTNINLTNRNCGSLAATTFDANNCQMLNLSGSFSSLAGDRLFFGTYTITDEVTNESCAFTLNLTREQVYQ